MRDIVTLFTCFLMLYITACQSTFRKVAEPPRGNYLRGIKTTVKYWKNWELGWTEQCEEELATLQIALVPEEHVLDVCWGQACPLHTEPRRPGIRYEARWYILISENAPNPLRGLVHELLHILGSCAAKENAYGLDGHHQQIKRWHGSKDTPWRKQEFIIQNIPVK